MHIKLEEQISKILASHSIYKVLTTCTMAALHFKAEYANKTK